MSRRENSKTRSDKGQKRKQYRMLVRKVAMLDRLMAEQVADNARHERQEKKRVRRLRAGLTGKREVLWVAGHIIGGAAIRHDGKPVNDAKVRVNGVRVKDYRSLPDMTVVSIKQTFDSLSPQHKKRKREEAIAKALGIKFGEARACPCCDKPCPASRQLVLFAYGATGSQRAMCIGCTRKAADTGNSLPSYYDEHASYKT